MRCGGGGRDERHLRSSSRVCRRSVAAAPHRERRRKFQMSGIWVIRNGGGFIPLQFAKTAGQILGIPASMVTPKFLMHISMVNLTGAFHFPNSVIPGGGV